MTRAVVFGGGGVTGIAWEAGVVRGLSTYGIDLTTADEFIGTSAGSVVGAHLAAGTTPDTLYRGQFLPAPHEISPPVDVSGLLAALANSTRGAADLTGARARVGRVALAAPVDDPEERRATISVRLTGLWWPTRLRTTAVDADTGEVVVFDHTTGVDLVDAVAASCAVPGVYPPVTAGGRRLMDGGAASVAHATLARDHPVVVVLAPVSPEPTPATTALADEVDELTAAGCRVVVIGPDPEYLRESGADPLDPARRADAARSGNAFASHVARLVRDIWSVDERNEAG